MSKNSVNIDFSIIWKKVHASLSREEEKQFKVWLEENADHQAYFDHVVNFYKNGSQFGDEAGLAEKDWPEFSEKLSDAKQRKWHIGRYVAAIAAAVVLILAVTAILKPALFEKQTVEQSIAIGPGTDKAILLMDDGTSYDLSSGKNVELEEEGTKITGLGKSLRYSKGDGKSGKIKYNTLVVPRGGQFSLTLEDGTKVWLNAGTTLKYPIAFRGDERRVELTGEAFFEVKRDEQKPFKVFSGEQIVEVLGTSFNVTSYQEEPSIYTTLVEGKVNVFLENNPQARQILVPNHQSVLVKGGNVLDQREVDVAEYISWKDGWFYFKDKPLEDIMKNLSRWYDVNVQFDNPQAKEVLFTGKIRRYEKLDEVLNLLEKTKEVKFKVERRNIIIN